MILYLQTLLLTIGVELSIVALLCRFKPNLKTDALLPTCVCINLLTHPFASLSHHWLEVPFIVVELAVLALEAVLYWLVLYRVVVRMSWRPSITLACASNLISMTVGLAFF